MTASGTSLTVYTVTLTSEDATYFCGVFASAQEAEEHAAGNACDTLAWEPVEGKEDHRTARSYGDRWDIAAHPLKRGNSVTFDAEVVAMAARVLAESAGLK